MSKIQPVNYQPQLKSAPKHGNYAAGQSFGSELSTAQKAVIDKTLIKKYLGLPGRFIDFLSETTGEMQTTIVVGIGTAFVAPIFIVHNPLSKQDKKTKKYSAWRQPISAVIATAVGLCINYPVGKYFDKHASEGDIKRFDMSAMPSRSFLKRKYKGIIKKFKELSEPDKKYFDMVSGGTISTLEAFQRKFPDVDSFKEAIHEKTLENTAQKLLKPDNKNGLRNLTAKDFLIKHLDFKIDPRNNTVLDTHIVESKLNKITAVQFLRVCGYSEDEINEKNLRTFIGNKLYSPKIRFTPGEKKYISRIAEMTMQEGSKNEPKITLKFLLKALGVDDDFYKCDEINQKMDQFLSWLDKNIDIKSAAESAKANTEMTVPRELSPEKRLVQFAKQIAKNSAEKSENAFKAYGKLQGIFLSLAVLPFACGLLNWSYPKIMKKYFPNLSETKSDKKGGK